jgi:hypothetical protein
MSVLPLQHTDIHALGEIQTRNPSRRASICSNQRSPAIELPKIYALNCTIIDTRHFIITFQTTNIVKYDKDENNF